MDVRILLAGIVPILMVTSGCVLFGSAFSLPPEATIGLLLITLPIIFLCWYILIRLDELSLGIKVQGRAIHRAMDEQVTDLKRRYDETMRMVTDMNSELTRRIYR